MTSLPVVSTQGGGLAVIDDQGELIPIREATDHLKLRTWEKLGDIINQAYAAKRALAAEQCRLYGVGTRHIPAGDFKVEQKRSWRQRDTTDALCLLVEQGSITEADFDAALPEKRVPAKAQCDALLARLLVDDPDAYSVLRAACSVGEPALADVRMGAVDGSAA